MRRRLIPMPFVVLLGSAIAWAEAWPEIHTPFLFNRTAGPADVRMTWVLRRVPCAATPRELAATLGPSDLADARTVALGSGQLMTLDGSSPVGACPDWDQMNTNPDPDCRAAIFETAGAEPVLMVAPQHWPIYPASYFCSPGPSPKTRCAPELDPANDGGDEALALVSRNGALAFEVSRPGGPLERTIRIGPVDPAAIAARDAAPDGCRQVRDAYRTLAQTLACTSDADCQALGGLPIPGEAARCELYVNKTVTFADRMAVESEWTDRLCASGGPSCPPSLDAICFGGSCAERCTGVDLPRCEPSCSSYPKGICADAYLDCGEGSENCHPICTNDYLARCVCRDNTVVCETRPLVDPACPRPCRQ